MKKIAIVGCGNPIRGDDGVGPKLIRKLWEMGLPPNIKLVDGGTSGIDVIFHIQDMDKVIFVDACYTGENAGTIYEVPVKDIEELPPLEEANLHSIKWFHAVAISKHMIKERLPEDIKVYLIEGKNFNIGDDLSEEVKSSIPYLIEKIIKECEIQAMGTMDIELKEDGYLVIPNEIVNKHFSGSLSVIVIPKGMQFTIIPLTNDKQGGLLLKRINSKGDAAVLVWELLPPGVKSGQKKAVWDQKEGGLVVSLL